MSDKKISQLTASTTPLAGTEALPIVQSGVTKKVATDDLTVKNLRSNATTGILQMAGVAAGQTRVVTVPDANFTAARTDAAQTFVGVQQFSDIDIVQATSGNFARRIDVVNFNDSTATNGNGFRFTWSSNNADIRLIRGPTDRDGVGLGLYSSSAWFVDPTLALEVLRNQDVKVNVGNLVIGTSGKGIDFSADGSAAGMTSELLDDYEEGTYDASLYEDGGSVLDSVTGYYTKIGNVVTIHVQSLGGTTGTTGVVRSNLPFTSAHPASNNLAYSVSNGGAVSCFVLNGGTYLEFVDTLGSISSGSKMIGSDISASSRTYFSLTYITSD